VSSLRIESVRLTWLETFIEMDEAENISAVARKLGVDQSTVSRDMQRLEKWLGKKLIDAGQINDPDDIGRSIAITEDGRAFLPIAQGIIEQLNGFRSEAGVRNGIMEECNKIVATMRAALVHPEKRKVASQIKGNIGQFEHCLSGIPDETPIDFLNSYRKGLREFYQDFEARVRSEKKKSKRKSQPVDVSDEWFDTQRARRQPT